MAFGDDQIGIGKTPFARRVRAGRLPSRRRGEDGVVQAARPPKLWPIAQNVRQNDAGDVNRLNTRDPLTTPDHNQGGNVQRHDGIRSNIIYGDSPTADNGNG